MSATLMQAGNIQRLLKRCDALEDRCERLETAVVIVCARELSFKRDMILEALGVDDERAREIVAAVSNKGRD